MSAIYQKPKTKRIKTFYTLMERGGFIANFGDNEQKSEDKPWKIKKVNLSNFDSESSDD